MDGMDTRRGIRDRLKTFVGTLSPTDRHVFMLRYSDRLHPIDIGLVMDLPEHHVSGILRRIDEESRRLVGRPPLLAGGGALA